MKNLNGMGEDIVLELKVFLWLEMRHHLESSAGAEVS